MPVLRSTQLVDAPIRTVAAAVRDVTVVQATGPRASTTARGDLLCVGDVLSFEVPLALGARVPMRTKIVRVDDTGLSSELASPDQLVRALRHDITLAETGAGTLITDSVRWLSPWGPIGSVADVLLMRRFVLRLLQRRGAAVRARVAELRAAPVVVAAAIVHKGHILAQQRSYPEHLAGRWELPGGRVEAGETDDAALVRECVEELGARIAVGARIGPDVPLPKGYLMRTYAATLADADELPEALEHLAVEWVPADRLAELDWLDPDIALLPDLRALLAEAP
ncbi:NUDIX domain-containing protein [Allokutzneria sp. A3M-2-11 16]|uniref:NUDIX domain-containing protein n=1 Tax=Allokutzneria sp. A3M-2-11 16 TaxID=2962043 RepID=UPI0020B8B47B|nr:NUDIX domain-containing protein [Allokutzneria sp. A3M-2-11 16]MCP3798646.1 NUDIX domain-containing protein [Allokutzneria sp. A3M-2-11 16]